MQFAGGHRRAGRGRRNRMLHEAPDHREVLGRGGGGGGGGTRGLPNGSSSSDLLRRGGLHMGLGGCVKHGLQGARLGRLLLGVQARGFGQQVRQELRMLPSARLLQRLLRPLQFTGIFLPPPLAQRAADAAAAQALRRTPHWRLPARRRQRRRRLPVAVAADLGMALGQALPHHQCLRRRLGRLLPQRRRVRRASLGVGLRHRLVAGGAEHLHA
mmetsp:Transcript_99028/g.317637  ORF Transcript_99028/g.317637 Transcript_99028/m.317637 type:complete len:214 (-) Transcript_99028:881-1522(-)